MDELKKYLRQHEEDMEVEMPGEKRMWERLEAHRQKNEPKRIEMFTRRFVAAACVLLLIGLGIWQWIKKDSKQLVPTEVAQNDIPVIKHGVLKKDSITTIKQLVATTQVKKKKNQAIKILPKEQLPMADGYAQLVNYQMQRLRSTPVYAESPEYFDGFRQQLQQMEEDEALLKNDIQLYGMNDQLLEALINLYQQKLNLLKSLKGEINKMNKTTIDKQSQDKLPPYFLNL